MKKILALLIGCGTVLSALSQTQNTTQQANANLQVITSLNNDQFSTLLRKVRNHASNSSRIEATADVINNSNYYFNTSQLKMLLESFNGDERRLQLAKAAYDRITDKMNFATLASVLNTQTCKEDLAAFINTQNKSNVVYSYSESFHTPLTDANFSNIYNDIEVQWQEGSRLSSIIDVFDKPKNYFTVAQVKQLMELISDEGSKLHLAKAAYSRVSDPENFAQLYDLFDTPERIDNLKTYIGANAHSIAMTHNAGKIAMSDDLFTNLYNDAKNHFRKKSIIKAVNNAFADTSNFYTSYQARQLILLIKGEQNRLAAAKAAYRGITDPSNFTAQMNDLFSSQESRDELQRYIDTYR